MTTHTEAMQTILESIEFNIWYFRDQLKELRKIVIESNNVYTKENAKTQISQTEKQIERLKHAMIYIQDLSRRKMI